MSRMSRIVNYTCTTKQTWYKVFSESDYKNNPIKEVKVKLRETSTENHFRYNYDGSTTIYMTSTTGFTVVKNIKQIWVYMPNNDAEVLEIEVLYK